MTSLELVRELGGGRYARVSLMVGPSGESVVVKSVRGSLRDGLDVTNGMFFAVGRAFYTGTIGAWDPEPADILAAEAQVLEQVDHAAMVRLLEVDNGRLVLEYIDGATWRELIAAGRVGPPQVAALAHALAEMAGSGQMSRHGDIKPDNLFLDPQGRVRIIDPCARATGPAPRHMLLTPLYNPYSSESDLPALGVLLMEVLAGRHPILHGRQVDGRVGDSLAERMEILQMTGHDTDWITRLRLPHEIDPALSSEIEEAALRCLGLAWREGRLEACDPWPGVKDLAECLDRVT